mmetsp:Transcript_87975/g.278154  ORF Transcript_87975/g.278154 Transcript_87975/m.278154 type:complete len:294 (+) Transcript_87975:825-1706(+)
MRPPPPTGPASCLETKLMRPPPPRGFVLFSTSVMRFMATPEGLVAFWIFKPVSMTASHCSGVNVESRSTTPSARSLTLMNIWMRWSTGATCLMRLTMTPLGFRARSMFSGGLITAAHCEEESMSRASPTQGSRLCVSINSVEVMHGSSSSSSSPLTSIADSLPASTRAPPSPSFSAAAACASAEAAFASWVPASWLPGPLSGKSPRGSTGGCETRAVEVPEPSSLADNAPPLAPRRARAADASHRTLATPCKISLPEPGVPAASANALAASSATASSMPGASGDRKGMPAQSG